MLSTALNLNLIQYVLCIGPYRMLPHGSILSSVILSGLVHRTLDPT